LGWFLGVDGILAWTSNTTLQFANTNAIPPRALLVPKKIDEIAILDKNIFWIFTTHSGLLLLQNAIGTIHAIVD